MSEPTSPDKMPFQPLGNQLKLLREQLKESLLEASGAVEIEPDELGRIEDGIDRPSEDILMLLIQHYNPHDQQALQLWEMAGYDGQPSEYRPRLDDLATGVNGKQFVMLMAMDMRTMYSDGVDIDITKAGLTMNFTQAVAPDRRAPVGRIGMSYDQAYAVLTTLEKALLKAQYLKKPQALPQPKKDDSSTEASK